MANQRSYGPRAEQGTRLEEDGRGRERTNSNSGSEDADIESRETKGNGAGGLATGLRWLEVLLLFIAFVFMVFASSTPITKNFYIFSLKVSVNAVIDKVSDAFTFGVWGYCSSGVSNSLGVGKLKINSKVTGGGCSNRKLGWTFKNVPGLSDNLQDEISKALTGMFIMHVVAAVFIFPALCAAAIGAAKPDMLVKHSQTDTGDAYNENGEQEPREEGENAEEEREETVKYQEPDEQDVSAGRRKLRGIVALAIFISLFFLLIVFFIDVVGLLVTKNKVHDKSKGDANLKFGPAFWLVIIASGLVLLAFLAAFVDLTVLVGKTSKDSAEEEDEDEEDIIVTDNTSPKKNTSPPYSGGNSNASTRSKYNDKDDEDEMHSVSLSDTEDQKRRRKRR